MKIDKATADDIRAVALAMRDVDLGEFLAVSYAKTREELAGALVERLAGRDDVLTGSLHGEPICIGGTFEGRPNVITLLFYATDDLPDIAAALNDWLVRELIPRYIAVGIHRFETIVAAENVAAQKWLRTLGMAPETGRLKGYGKGGEDFIQFSRVVS